MSVFLSTEIRSTGCWRTCLRKSSRRSSYAEKRVAARLKRSCVRSLLNEVAAAAHVTQEHVADAGGQGVVERGVLNWEWTQAILKAIDRHVPFASGTSIAIFTNDVYQYLKNPGIRDVIDDGVRQAIQPDVETVVVGHSLGSVVAFNLLAREGKALRWNVPLFVTVGSPLAVQEIFKSLRPVRHPACVTKWYNAMDERDVVALYPLNKKFFGVDPAIENKTDVRNFTANRHRIAGYLADPVVARRIYDALAD